MIHVNNLKKRFGDNEVLKDISFDIGKGEVIAIIGPSGSGKSTLLRSLNYLETPDDGLITIGDVSVDTKQVSKNDIQQLRKQTSMVFQHYNLFKNKTALENITYALKVNSKMSNKAIDELGLKLLEQVGLADKADVYPIKLSGGQQQRVAIARAVAVDPVAILFDEPTSSLDPEWIASVLEVISAIAKKGDTTMIIVTHEMQFAYDVADRVIFMSEGYIVEQGTAKEVLAHPQNERTKQFLQGKTF